MAGTGTLTRAELAESVHRTVGLSRAESGQFVESILGHMIGALTKGENVKISGFGTFVLRSKAERIGRNPKTGVEVPISPRRVLTFRASQQLREKVAKAS
jgi:integration host factor subunit alpha